MEENIILKTEKYSLKFIIFSSFTASIFITFLYISLGYFYKEKLVIDYFVLWMLIIFFLFFFILLSSIILITNKEYIYYCMEGKLFFELDNKKAYKFNLNSIYKIYSSKSFFYKGIKIVQNKPAKVKLTFLLKKDNDFQEWLKNEIDNYKNSEIKIQTKFISYDKIYKLNFGTTFFVILNIINISYLKMINYVWINIIISLVCFIGLIIIFVKIIKVISSENRNNVGEK